MRRAARIAIVSLMLHSADAAVADSPYIGNWVGPCLETDTKAEGAPRRRQELLRVDDTTLVHHRLWFNAEHCNSDDLAESPQLALKLRYQRGESRQLVNGAVLIEIVFSTLLQVEVNGDALDARGLAEVQRNILDPTRQPRLMRIDGEHRLILDLAESFDADGEHQAQDVWGPFERMP